MIVEKGNRVMHWALWIVVGIVGFIILAAIVLYVGFLIHFKLFGKKVTKANKEILKLLDDGLLEDFKENKPYEEVKERYCALVDLLDIFSQYMHFISMQEEKKFERQNDCIILQYVTVDGQKVARYHFRSFPIKTLLQKLKNKKETLIESIKMVEDLLYKDRDIAYMEFITHNLLFNESVIKKIISRENLQLDYTYDDQYENAYLPWIYSEWIMIHGGDNPKSKEVYEQIRKLNQPINIKLYRKGEITQAPVENKEKILAH